jgi:hypothetical protein
MRHTFFFRQLVSFNSLSPLITNKYMLTFWSNNNIILPLLFCISFCFLKIYLFQCVICTYYFILIQVCLQEEIVSAGQLTYNLGCQRKEVYNRKLYLIFNVVRKWKCNVICVCLRIVVSNTYCFMFLFLFLRLALCLQFLWIVIFWIARSVFSNVYLEDKSVNTKWIIRSRKY